MIPSDESKAPWDNDEAWQPDLDPSIASLDMTPATEEHLKAVSITPEEDESDDDEPDENDLEEGKPEEVDWGMVEHETDADTSHAQGQMEQMRLAEATAREKTEGEVNEESNEESEAEVPEPFDLEPDDETSE